MNLRIVHFLFSCFGLLFSLNISVIAADDWISVRSPNFQLVGNANDREMRRVADKLEQFRFVFTQLFSELKFTSPVQTTVIVFKDENSLNPFKPVDENGKIKSWVKGFFLPGNGVNYIVLSSEKGSEGDFTTIFHEYVHFLVDNTLGRTNVPPWFNEGLAEYYEQFETDPDGKITLGNINKSHLSLLQKSGITPFEKFFEMDYQTLYRQPKENVISFYAQAWALTHFLTHGKNGGRNKQFEQFSKLITKGISSKDAFREAFQTDYAAMEKELKKYLEQKKFNVSTADFKSFRFNSYTLKSASLTNAEAKAFQGDLLLHSNRWAEAAVLLEESLLLDSGLSMSNASMGLVKWKENKYPEAEKYLEKAIQNDSNNYFAFFTYSYALSRKGMTDFGFVVGYDAETAEKIRANLREAIALNPDFAESYQLFAFINAARNEYLDEGLEMIGQALKIAPGNQTYQLRNAELLMKKGDFTNARTITQKVIQAASNDRLRLYALNTLNLINSWEMQLKEIEENKNRPRMESVITEKVLSEEEIQKLNARAVLESLNQALRRPKTDEKRIVGFLSKVACEPTGVIYTVKSDNKIIKLKSRSIEEVLLRSFEANLVNLQFGCDVLKAEEFAVITFRPASGSVSELSGEVTAIEFVPDNFVFIDLSLIKTRTHF